MQSLSDSVKPFLQISFFHLRSQIIRFPFYLGQSVDLQNIKMDDLQYLELQITNWK